MACASSRLRFAIAVSDELAIVHPGYDTTLGFTILTFGGPALFLLAQVIFNREALGHAPRSRPLALAALAIPRGRHGTAHADRRERGVERRARRGRNR
jgi:hypothetical protein